MGASNLSLSFPTIVTTVRRTWGEPIEFMSAMGHGRSYGHDSMVWGRKISGIFPCALWQDLQKRAKLPTTALVTDIGNDLLYGRTPNQLLEWVEGCLDRLDAAGAATIVTLLPATSIERLSERRFQFFRRLIFPRSTLTLAGAKELIREMNERLIAIGAARKLSVIPASLSWYGVDPIHLTRRARPVAWPAILADWSAAEASLAPAKSSVWMSAYLTALAPEKWSRFGVERRAAQPCGRFSDGTTISLY